MAEQKTKWTVIKTEGDYQTVEILVKDGEKEKVHQYKRPTDWPAFQRLVAAATPEQGETYLALHDYSLNLKERAKVREAAESTLVGPKDKQIDLMAIPLDRALLAINGIFANAAVTGREPSNPYIVARRLLLEQGKAKEQGGILVKA